MKTISWMIGLSVSLGIIAGGCDDDDEKVWMVDSDPVLKLKAGEIHSEQGRTVRIEGTVLNGLHFLRFQQHGGCRMKLLWRELVLLTTGS